MLEKLSSKKSNRKRTVRKETYHERIERKKREYNMAFIRTASNVLAIIFAFLSLGLNIMIVIKVYTNG